MEKDYLPGDIPYKGRLERYDEPNRDESRFVYLGGCGGGYADESIYYDKQADRFITDIYSWGVVDDADHRYHGMKVIDREYVLTNTYYPSKVFEEVMGRMPEEYYIPPEEPPLKPEKCSGSVLLVWPVVRDIMDIYYRYSTYENNYSGMRELLEAARKEIVEARQYVEEIDEYLRQDDSDGMLDQLIAHMGEASLYDFRKEMRDGCLYIRTKIDNLGLFNSVIAVNLIGIILKLSGPSNHYNLYLKIDTRYEPLEENINDMLGKVVDVLPYYNNIRYIFFDSEE